MEKPCTNGRQSQEWEAILSDPRAMQTIRGAAERGVKIQVVVHKNAAPILEELGSEGLIELYYLPYFPDHTYQVSDTDHIQHVGYLKPDVVTTLEGCRGIADGFRRNFKKNRENSYSVPKEKVHEVFRMIREGSKSCDIVNHIQGD